MKTILIIRSSAMGDVAMTAPVLTQMAIKYPDVKMVMLTRDFYEPFFDGIDNLDIYNIDLAETHRGIRGTYLLYKQLTENFEFDAIIDLNDKLYTRLLRFFFRVNSRKTQIFHINKGRQEKKDLTRKSDKTFVQLRTSIQRYEDVFKEAGFNVNAQRELVKVARNIPKQLDDFNTNCIGIAPFAKHTGKILPLATVRQFIELMNEKYPQTKIYIFGGGASEKNAAKSLTAWYSNCESLISKITLKDEMDVMANIKCMVSMDSSAMHICSVVGTPVISVWGATHPYAGFLGLNQSTDDVVSVDLPCRPCSIYGLKPCYKNNYECLNKIDANQILVRVEKYL